MISLLTSTHDYRTPFIWNSLLGTKFQPLSENFVERISTTICLNIIIRVCNFVKRVENHTANFYFRAVCFGSNALSKIFKRPEKMKLDRYFLYIIISILKKKRNILIFRVIRESIWTLFDTEKHFEISLMPRRAEARIFHDKQFCFKKWKRKMFKNI